MNKKIFFTRCNNFGDELNLLITNIFSKDSFVYTSNIRNIDYIGIGSMLDASIFVYLPAKSFKACLRNLYYKLKTLFVKKTITTLGTGICFDYANPSSLKFVRKMRFPIIRGKKTEVILQKSGAIMNEKPVLGDLGLLASDLLDQKIAKTHKLGVVPHFRDLDNPLIWKIIDKYEGAICINVQDPPQKVIHDIASCELILSTSLHGLIVADSLGIPNLWLENKWARYSRNVADYRFKYNDYYSSFGLQDFNPIDIIDFIENYDLEDIKKNNKLSINQVECKKNELRQALKKILL